MPGGGSRVASRRLPSGRSSEEDDEEEACSTTGGSVTGSTPFFSSASILMRTSVAAESLGDAFAGAPAGASAPPSGSSVEEAQRATMASASALSGAKERQARSPPF